MRLLWTPADGFPLRERADPHADADAEVEVAESAHKSIGLARNDGTHPHWREVETNQRTVQEARVLRPVIIKGCLIIG